MTLVATTQNSRRAQSNYAQRNGQRMKCLVPWKPGLSFQPSDTQGMLHPSAVHREVMCASRQQISSLETDFVTFPSAVIKYPDKGNSRENRFIPALSWRLQSITVRA